MTRLIALAVLALSLLAPPAAAAVRTEFFGIVQGPTLSDFDIHGIRGMQNARVQTNRFLIEWEWVQPEGGSGSFRWGPADKFIGRLASRGIRALPALWGNRGNPMSKGGPARPPLDKIAAWRAFLKAVVGRYGRNGTYWSTAYADRYNTPPLPIHAYQVWNEPNLKKYFVPYPAPNKYAQLLNISYPVIKSKDAQAKVVLAGMPSNGDVQASEFLNSLYSAGAKPNFDVAALHPYAKTINRQRDDIARFRTVMKNRGDQTTPLWLTELAWGSDPPDRFGINKGLQGQRTFLRDTFDMVLAQRKAWNVQRLFWYRWRDPFDPQASCSFCGSAGFLKPDRTPKPSYNAYLSYTAETDPPAATITSGPAQGSTTSDSTPRFTFTSDEPGSTYECRVDGALFAACGSPRTLAPPLADGTHTFSVRATDAPGNVSPVVSRTFTVNAP